MENFNKTYSDVIREEAEVRAEERRSLEIAKNLLDILDNSIIALKTGLSLTQI